MQDRTAMGEIYLIRHGQASFGADNYDRLSDTGVMQSVILGDHLAQRSVPFDAVYTGGMDRQEKTAEQVLKRYLKRGQTLPDPVVDNRFNEYDAHAVWQTHAALMRSEGDELLDAFEKDRSNGKKFQKVFAKVLNRWISGAYDTPGVETWQAFKARVSEGLLTLIRAWQSSHTIAVFSSGGAISVAVQQSLNLSDPDAIELSWQIMNGAVTRMKFSGDRLTLSGFNNVTHFEITGDNRFLTYR